MVSPAVWARCIHPRHQKGLEGQAARAGKCLLKTREPIALRLTPRPISPVTLVRCDSDRHRAVMIVNPTPVKSALALAGGDDQMDAGRIGTGRLQRGSSMGEDRTGESTAGLLLRGECR